MKIYLAVAAGITISVVLPLLRALLPKPPTRLAGESRWLVIRPYLATGVFSLIVAVLIVAAMGDQLQTWSAALIAGYTWDSTLQKLTTGNTSA